MPTTILIVDDSATMRAALRLYLRDDGYDFAEADTGERALRLARLLRPSLALVDVNLPDMDGFAIVRALGEGAQKVPTLVITGEEGPQWAAKAKASGAAGLVHKPVDAAVLRASIAAILAQVEA